MRWTCVCSEHVGNVLRGWSPPLLALRKCDRSYSHVRVKGQVQFDDGSMVWRSTMAQSWPPSFVSSLTHLIVSQLPPRVFDYNEVGSSPLAWWNVRLGAVCSSSFRRCVDVAARSAETLSSVGNRPALSGGVTPYPENVKSGVVADRESRVQKREKLFVNGEEGVLRSLTLSPMTKRAYEKSDAPPQRRAWVSGPSSAGEL